MNLLPEILTEIRLPPLPAGIGWAFEEFARRSGDFALAAVGVLTGPDTRIVAIGANEIPIRLHRAEALCTDFVNFDDITQTAQEEVSPNSDLHGSADYRRHLIGILTRRALTLARERAL